MVTAQDSKAIMQTYRGSATFGTATVDGTGEELVAANASRQSGVWVQVSNGTPAFVGTSAADDNMAVGASGFYTIFIPGRSAVYARSSGASSVVNYIEI